MYRDQFGEFVCGYWGLKGYVCTEALSVMVFVPAKELSGSV